VIEGTSKTHAIGTDNMILKLTLQDLPEELSDSVNHIGGKVILMMNLSSKTNGKKSYIGSTRCHNSFVSFPVEALQRVLLHHDIVTYPLYDSTDILSNIWV
jgi:hypothetical protein